MGDELPAAHESPTDNTPAPEMVTGSSEPTSPAEAAKTDGPQPLERKPPERETSHPIERFTLWFGAVCGILVALHSLYKGFTETTPPEFAVVFSMTGSDSFAVAPLVQSNEADWTEPFPFGLRISNRGGKTAEEVVLRFNHPRNFGIRPVANEADYQLIHSPNGQRILTSIPIGDIHPGETLHLDGKLVAFTENFVDAKVDVESRDGVPVEVPFTAAATFEIEARLSAKDVAEKSTFLYASVGSADYFREAGTKFVEVQAASNSTTE